MKCPTCKQPAPVLWGSNEGAHFRTGREADTALLEACWEELLSQWESNHAEHCTNILPCPQTQAGPLGCQWPRPAVFSLLDERLQGEVKTGVL